jgi:large subunit ribosomal protein L19
MSQALLRSVEESHRKADVPVVNVGDTVDVHVRIVEGAKERIQVFQGVVIRLQGSGVNRSFTVRRIVANEGVERTFLLHSPRLAQIDVKRQGHTRRAKLYYLRDRVGKKRRLRDRRRGLGNGGKAVPEVPETPVTEPVAETAAAE